MSKQVVRGPQPVAMDRFDLEENIVKSFLAGGEKMCRRTVRTVIDTFIESINKSEEEVAALKESVANLNKKIGTDREVARTLVGTVDDMWRRADVSDGKISADDVCETMTEVRVGLDAIIDDDEQEQANESQADPVKS